jgi:hypothetical protein
VNNGISGRNNNRMVNCQRLTFFYFMLSLPKYNVITISLCHFCTKSSPDSLNDFVWKSRLFFM